MQDEINNGRNTAIALEITVRDIMDNIEELSNCIAYEQAYSGFIVSIDENS